MIDNDNNTRSDIISYSFINAISSSLPYLPYIYFFRFLSIPTQYPSSVFLLYTHLFTSISYIFYYASLLIRRSLIQILTSFILIFSFRPIAFDFFLYHHPIHTHTHHYHTISHLKW